MQNKIAELAIQNSRWIWANSTAQCKYELYCVCALCALCSVYIVHSHCPWIHGTPLLHLRGRTKQHRRMLLNIANSLCSKFIVQLFQQQIAYPWCLPTVTYCPNRKAEWNKHRNDEVNTQKKLNVNSNLRFEWVECKDDAVRVWVVTCTHEHIHIYSLVSAQMRRGTAKICSHLSANKFEKIKFSFAKE